MRDFCEIAVCLTNSLPLKLGAYGRILLLNIHERRKKKKQCEIEKYQDLFILNTLIDDDEEEEQEEISFDK